ncbi:hypothetical protein ACFR9U_20650 [Halorientalis brevis]|uniref:Uncharacterized protein n=1 Tax=Halorientalis brevis TaxID=1126241 RepID=A0ABD6CJF0_9EURY|nr:hypothetical protein [Halorientalis brevis]
MDPVLERVRAASARLTQPAYTGTNRCLPCTVLNVVIAVAISSVLAARRSVATGVTALSFCSAIIYLRGYLVPGTPTITREYAPPWFLRLFGKQPSRPPSIDVDAVAAERAGDAQSPAVSDAFRAAWRERIAELRGDDPDPRQVAETLGVDASDLSAVPGSVAYVLDDDLLQWESELALVADVAAADLLDARSDRWAHLSPGERRRVLSTLRSAFEDCPRCGGPLDRTTARLDSCCTDPTTVVSVTCPDCGACVLHRPQDDSGTDAADR